MKEVIYKCTRLVEAENQRGRGGGKTMKRRKGKLSSLSLELFFFFLLIFFSVCLVWRKKEEEKTDSKRILQPLID